ncbi:MAG: class I SAM-dependent methyltransferase [Gemmatimonadota bacterium]|nr:class I SAM-dependent methyltransferase [Gemmatimonadota bacterium]
MVASREQPGSVVEETDRVRGIYDLMAPRYERVIAIADRVLFDDGRRWACAGATGQVLEVAIGTGRNLPFYPPGAQLTGVDLSPKMLDRARARAETLARSVDLQLGDAQQLTFPDATFDTVVATLSVCSVPDDQAAVAEMALVLRPGGRLVLLDHVASTSRPVRAVQRLLDPALVRALGDHLLRDPEIAVRRAGLIIEDLIRSRWNIVLRLAARKPSTA